jgi:hypothetical protein
MRAGLAALAIATMIAACGSAAKSSVGPQPSASGIPASLLAAARPIGRGPRFHPADRGPILGSCRPTFGRRLEAHVEVFGANRVVLLSKGIGTGRPRKFLDGRLTQARCFGGVVTLDPTGTLYVRTGSRYTLGDLFRTWGQTLTGTRVASFSGGRTTVYVGGRLWHGAATAVPLTEHSEIVVEIGPHVPPHRRFAFPPLPVQGFR